MAKGKLVYVDVICTQFAQDQEGYKHVVAEYPKRFEKTIWDNSISKMKFGNKEFRIAPKQQETIKEQMTSAQENTEPEKVKVTESLTEKKIMLMKKADLIVNLISRYGGTEDDWQFTNNELKEKLIASLNHGLNT